MLTTIPAVCHAASLPLFSVLVKTGIKAEEKVPKTKTSKIVSGNLKAAKNRESSSGVKKWAKVLWRINPKNLDAITINIIIEAADKTVVWGETKRFLLLSIIFLTILHVNSKH